MSTEQATQNEAAERLAEQVILACAERRPIGDLLLRLRYAERRNVVEQIAAGLGMFLYNRDFHMSHEESVRDARGLIARWLGTEEEKK